MQHTYALGANLLLEFQRAARHAFVNMMFVHFNVSCLVAEDFGLRSALLAVP